jgi:hypothetical protein
MILENPNQFFVPKMNLISWKFQVKDVIFTVGESNLVSWALDRLGVQLEKDVPGFPEGSKK